MSTVDRLAFPNAFNGLGAGVRDLETFGGPVADAQKIPLEKCKPGLTRGELTESDALKGRQIRAEVDLGFWVLGDSGGQRGPG